MDLRGFWVLGLLLNLFFLSSVFQIYFHSPLFPISVSFKSNYDKNMVKRIVFIVGDGLRADSFYSHTHLHPHLTGIIKEGRGSWGISDTRVPTESRPGHIALFGGIYEDPSAIFSGWQKNLVSFDTVFNRSSHFIALGSPDIVLMFTHQLDESRGIVESYPSSWQDFSQKNSSLLDIWVLDTLKELVKNKKLPEGDSNIIFLHLLGIDNTGHATKPNSPEYLSSIEVVDRIVAETEKLINNYYRDEETLFIFTSDHGMTDWGSHGDGSRAETETPFVIWGAGIKGSAERQLRLVQTDFAPLISGSLKIPIPTNSIGKFPTSLFENKEFSYKALLANFRQLRELMRVKKEFVNRGMLPFFPYKGEGKIETILEMGSVVSESSQNYEKEIEVLEEGMSLLSSGISYYERYDELLLSILIFISFILWISLIFLTIIHVAHSDSTGKYLRINLISTSNLIDLLIALIITIGIFEWSIWRVPYSLTPIYLTRLLLPLYTKLPKGSTPYTKLFLSTLIGGSVLSSSFRRREVLGVGMVVSGIWVLYSRKHKLAWKEWTISLLTLSLFPFLELMGRERNGLLLSIAPLSTSVLSFLYLSSSSLPPHSRLLLLSQTILLTLSPLLSQFPHFIITHLFAWISLPLFIIFPISLSSSLLTPQFLSLFMGLLTSWTYLGVSVESVFIVVLGANLILLVWIERGGEFYNGGGGGLSDFVRRARVRERGSERELGTAFRIGWLNVFYIYFGFFGQGNIGSLSSFDPSSVSCFLSIFRPFIMMGLLVFKIICPSILISCSFSTLLTSQSQIQINFLISLLLSTVGGTVLFFNVQNVGSWLQIGTSISHYIISQSTTLLLFIFIYLSNLLLGKSTT